MPTANLMAPRKAPSRRGGQSKHPAQVILAAFKANSTASASNISEAIQRTTRSGRTLRQNRPFGHVQEDEEPKIASALGAKRKREAPVEAEGRKKQKTATEGRETRITVSAQVNISLASPITSREPSAERQLTTVSGAHKVSLEAATVPLSTSTNGTSPSKQANPELACRQPAQDPSALQPSTIIARTAGEKLAQDAPVLHTSVTPLIAQVTHVAPSEQAGDVSAVELHKSPSPAATSSNGPAQGHTVSNREFLAVPDTTGIRGQSYYQEDPVSRRSSGSRTSIRGSNVANKGEQWRRSQERERRRAQNKRAMAVNDEAIQQLREKRIRREMQELQENSSRREFQSRTSASLTPAATRQGIPQQHAEKSLSASPDHGQPTAVVRNSEKRDSVVMITEKRTPKELVPDKASPEECRSLDPAIIQAAASVGVDMVSVAAYLEKAEKLIIDARLIPATPTNMPMTKDELALLARNEARKAIILEEARVIVGEGKMLMPVLKDASQCPMASKPVVGNIVDYWKVLERYASDLRKVGLWD